MNTQTQKAIESAKAALQSNGHIFTVTFVKKDGTKRTLNGRFGVYKYIRGGTGCLKAGNWNFYDMSDSYRSVIPESILSISYDGQNLNFSTENE